MIELCYISARVLELQHIYLIYCMYVWTELPTNWESVLISHGYIPTNKSGICKCMQCYASFGAIPNAKLLQITNPLTYIFPESNGFKGSKSIFRITVRIICSKLAIRIISHIMFKIPLKSQICLEIHCCIGLSDNS